MVRQSLWHSLHLHLLLDQISAGVSDYDENLSFPSLSTPSYQLCIKPFIFWNRHGSKKLNINKPTSNINIQIFLEENTCMESNPVKHLKWKFRGNARIEVDGVQIQVSWDVDNWLFEGSCGFEFETKKMKKGLLRSAGSSTSSSLSSASLSYSSVMEWASMEENELKGPSGFSLLVYAWKSRR
ncbi:unnamed protein product [Ilex paraguariensis]|uniref:Uncharacterized protein n=1 Tax=Ilex paraguariensis TaxID=185542 RepID=A0ABC8RYT6_9AQUA